jgi:hypothetical protein
MTKKQDPIDLDAVMLITHSAQSIWTFEEYMQRVLRASRIKLKKIGKGLKESE